jgi:hypothetical protein
MQRLGPMTLLISLCLVGCADSKDNTESDSQDLAPIATESLKTEVDATSRTDWVGFDLDSGKAIGAADLADDASWDLGFKRTSIKMNGANVKLKIVDKAYEALDLAPKDGYVSDQPATEAGAIETAGLAFHDPAWYAYDINTHLVSSANLVYVIETNDGRHFKLKFTDYYNVERLPAFINFEYQELTGVEQ